MTSPKSRIGEAQISADGQWILFTADDAQGFGTTLQLVRMDGQGLQTLYCSMSGNGVGNIQWSPDQKTVVFVDVHGFIGLGVHPPQLTCLIWPPGISRWNWWNQPPQVSLLHLLPGWMIHIST